MDRLVDYSFNRQIAVNDVLDVTSSRVADLDIDWFVGTCESHILNRDILDSATHLAANGDACENAMTCDIPDCDIHGRLIIRHTEAIPSRFNRDAVCVAG